MRLLPISFTTSFPLAPLCSPYLLFSPKSPFAFECEPYLTANEWELGAHGVKEPMLNYAA